MDNGSMIQAKRLLAASHAVLGGQPAATHPAISAARHFFDLPPIVRGRGIMPVLVSLHTVRSLSPVRRATSLTLMSSTPSAGFGFSQSTCMA
jgi:hypothetical protein